MGNNQQTNITMTDFSLHHCHCFGARLVQLQSLLKKNELSRIDEYEIHPHIAGSFNVIASPSARL
jgi:hypothetical protein